MSGTADVFEGDVADVLKNITWEGKDLGKDVIFIYGFIYESVSCPPTHARQSAQCEAQTTGEDFDEGKWKRCTVLLGPTRF